MCGIAGHFCFGDARPRVASLRVLLVGQENRGRSASGVGYRTANGFQIIKGPILATQLAARISNDEWEAMANSPVSLLHARATTKGTERNNENNHPVEGGTWAVVHNGHVANDDDLVEHYGVERPAEVDTVAIALALSQGTTIQESLAHLATLAGAASFAALQPHGTEELILARLNGPPVFTNYDRENRILYWSSDNRAIFEVGRPGLAGLNYNNVALIPDRSALLLSPSGRAARFEVPRRPFFRPTQPRALASTPETRSITEGGPRSGPIVSIRRAVGRIRGQLQTSVEAVVNPVESTRFYSWLQQPDERGVFVPVGTMTATSDEDYVRMAKPEPDFTENRVVLLSDIPNEDFSLRTAYGTWRQKEGNRTFKPAKRVRPHWAVEINIPLGIEMELPASVPIQEALEGTCKLEVVAVQYEGVTTYPFMCPWCGVLGRTTDWINKWNHTCPMCRVKSYRG